MIGIDGIVYYQKKRRVHNMVVDDGKMIETGEICSVGKTQKFSNNFLFISPQSVLRKMEKNLLSFSIDSSG